MHKIGIFEAFLTTRWWFSNFSGRFWTKKWLNQKMFVDLFGPKWGKEYIQWRFEPFRVDLGWSEITFWAIRNRGKCYILMCLCRNFGPDVAGYAKFRTKRFTTKKYRQNAIWQLYTMWRYLLSFPIYDKPKMGTKRRVFVPKYKVWPKFRTGRSKLLKKKVSNDLKKIISPQNRWKHEFFRTEVCLKLEFLFSTAAYLNATKKSFNLS